MVDDETFHEFYSKLSNSVNSSFNLGEKRINSKIICKILISLSKRLWPSRKAKKHRQTEIG